MSGVAGRNKEEVEDDTDNLCLELDEHFFLCSQNICLFPGKKKTEPNGLMTKTLIILWPKLRFVFLMNYYGPTYNGYLIQSF